MEVWKGSKYEVVYSQDPTLGGRRSELLWKWTKEGEMGDIFYSVNNKNIDIKIYFFLFSD